MDVTRGASFERSLPLFEGILKRASFVAVDLEMTGLNRLDVPSRPMPDDDEERVFQRVRDSALHFLPTQVGVCPFVWDAEKGRYQAYPFNVNVWPACDGVQAIDASGRKALTLPQRQPFMAQPSSLEFLSHHHFDYNKWIKEGVPFLSQADERTLRKGNAKMFSDSKRQWGAAAAAAAAASSSSSTTTTTTSDAPAERSFGAEVEVTSTRDIQFVVNLRAQVTAWLEDPNADTFMQLAAVNPFLRRVTYEEMRRRFPAVECTKGTDARGHPIIVLAKFRDAAHKQRWQEQEANRPELELAKAIGFRHFIDLISQAGIPVVGHNCFLDMMHIVQSFVDNIPTEPGRYKQMLCSLFPQIYDTKLVSSLARNEVIAADEQKDESNAPEFAGDLATLYRVTCDPAGAYAASVASCPVEFGPDFDRYNDATKAHEAGYDAYMTGVVFARLCSTLHRGDVLASGSLAPQEGPVPPPFSADSPMINRFANLIRFHGHNDTYFNLKGPSPLAPREKTLYISGLTMGIRNDMITREFAQYARVKNVKWRNDSSCFVTFIDKTTVEQVEAALFAVATNTDWTLMDFPTYLREVRDLELEKLPEPMWVDSEAGQPLAKRVKPDAGGTRYPHAPQVPKSCVLM